MKQNTIGWWIVSVFLGLALLGAGSYITWIVRSAREARAVREIITKSDYSALLAACRQMIANREKYRNDWPSDSSSDGERALDRSKGEYGEDVPTIIRQMHPWHIVVNRHRVLVFVHGPPRTGFIGYTEGTDELEMLNRTHATMLTNGLWMFTN